MSGGEGTGPKHRGPGDNGRKEWGYKKGVGEKEERESRSIVPKCIVTTIVRFAKREREGSAM